MRGEDEEGTAAGSVEKVAAWSFPSNKRASVASPPPTAQPLTRKKKNKRTTPDLQRLHG